MEQDILTADLFSPRAVYAEQSLLQVKKVLLVGWSGVGKSTVARQLASDWAQGTWGNGIIALFLVAVCNLQISRFRGSYTNYVSETLGSAIALECLNGTLGESRFRRVRSVVELTLAEASTLVILDGLDESLSCSRYILDEATYGCHKLLQTSRPYGVKTKPDTVDLVVEHKGLSPR